MNRNRPEHPWHEPRPRWTPPADLLEDEPIRERNYSDRLQEGFDLLNQDDPDDRTPELD